MLKVSNDFNGSKFLIDKIKLGLFPVFDLDGVILDASHRIKLFNFNDLARGACSREQIGQLDLAHYRKNTTRNNVLKDKTLPLYRVLQFCNNNSIKYAVCTARVVDTYNLELFDKLNIKPIHLFDRGDDKRSDHLLKVDKLATLNSRLKSRAILIDDCIANCQEVANKLKLATCNVLFTGNR